MKSGTLNVSIGDLYKHLKGDVVEEEPKVKAKGRMVAIDNTKTKKPTKKNPLVSLNDLMSQTAISTLDYKDKVKFAAIIKDITDKYIH